MGFAKFMSSAWGRGLRIFVGIGLVYWGYSLGDVWMYVLLVVGAVMALAGALNVCIFAPLFGGPFNGKDVK